MVMDQNAEDNQVQDARRSGGFQAADWCCNGFADGVDAWFLRAVLRV
jgi:hypothetical protein